ncbi:MAG: sigma-70 family RNA polymerase sigma factor [Acidimicrobiales bacterium]
MNPVTYDNPRRLSAASTSVGPAQSGVLELSIAYREHASAVYSLAVRVCGSSAAEDVTQDVFLRLWSNPERFDPARGSLRTLLLTMARNRAVDLVRSGEARRQREHRSAPSFGPAPADVEGLVEEKDTNSQILGVLDTLPPREKEAIVTAFYGACTYREAAAVLNQSEGTVKSRIRAGLRRLAADLDESSGLVPSSGLSRRG